MHRIDALDVQPVDSTMTDNKTSFLIGIAGTVKYGDRSPYKNFNQHFVVSKIDDKLKIISDTIRISEAPDQRRRI